MFHYLSLDAALAIVKIVSVLLTGCFAIIGLLVEYKDKATGKITKGGRMALIGIVLSTTLALVSQVIEQNKSIEEVRESAARSEKLLTEISKSLQPLREAQISLFFDIDVNDSEFHAYKARLVQGIQEYIKRHPKLDIEAVENNTGLSWGRAKDQKIEVVVVHANSALSPNEKTEPVAYSALNFRAHVCLRKTRQKEEPLCKIWSDSGDFRFLAERRKIARFEHDLSLTDDSHLEVEIGTSELRVAEELTQVEASTRSNGRILSVPDLVGSEIEIYLENINPSVHDQLITTILENKISVKTPTIFFRVQGHDYLLPNTRAKVLNGQISLSASFPTTAEALTELER
jgi:hypothetical protein